MPNKTAVEWLWLNLTDDMIGELSPEQIKSIYDLVQQALAMEKGQKIKFANEYAESGSFYCNGEFAIEKDAEDYYNETYKGGQDERNN
jgi:hypothetical protein